LLPFDSAGPGDLTLAVDRRNLRRLGSCAASAAIVPPGAEPHGLSVLEVDDPKATFARLLELFNRRPFVPAGISNLAFVGRECQIPDEVTVAPFASLGDRVVLGPRTAILEGARVGEGCVLGADVIVHPNVVLYPGVQLGDRVIIHSGTVIGADGFGYVWDGGRHVKVPQTGTVVIEDDVEIGANSCVDRATFGATVIERGVKLDNHVHIGHNCRVGRDTIMVAQVGVSGSVNIGRSCIFAGHSGVVDHVTIGDHVKVMMKSGVSKDVPSGGRVSGSPAMDHEQAMRIEAVKRRLPELYRELKALKARLERKK
jgi:UDP-3-O-[3-hydroxymyristoyl] glucosamine N-acyltransferase